MIETVVLKHLQDNMNTPVYMEFPEELPEEFVIIERTGGYESNQIPQATMEISSYGETLYKSAMLNEAVKKAMRTLKDESQIGRVALSADYNSTDTGSKRYRYIAVYEITHYQEV